LLDEPGLRLPLAGKRVALLAHPASVTRDLMHTLDALAALPDFHHRLGFVLQVGTPADGSGDVFASAIRSQSA
jgi:uncharacterized protein YbbC (DUF1343 family)